MYWSTPSSPYSKRTGQTLSEPYYIVFFLTHNLQEMTVYFPNMFNEHHCYGLFTLICVFAQIMSSKHERILIKADFLAAVCRATFPLLQRFFHVTFSMNFPDLKL